MSDVITVIVYGPAGCGKTTNAEALRAKYGCAKVVDGFYPMIPSATSFLTDGGDYLNIHALRGALILTNMDPDALAPWALKLHAIAIPFASAMRGLDDARTAPEAKPAYPAKTLGEMRTLHLQNVVENRDGFPRPTLQDLLDELSETAQETTSKDWWPEQSLTLQLLVWQIQDRFGYGDSHLLDVFNRGRKAAPADPMPLDPPPDDPARDAVLARLSYQMDEFAARLDALEKSEACAW